MLRLLPKRLAAELVSTGISTGIALLLMRPLLVLLAVAFVIAERLYAYLGTVPWLMEPPAHPRLFTAILVFGLAYGGMVAPGSRLLYRTGYFGEPPGNRCARTMELLDADGSSIQSIEFRVQDGWGIGPPIAAVFCVTPPAALTMHWWFGSQAVTQVGRLKTAFGTIDRDVGGACVRFHYSVLGLSERLSLYVGFVSMNPRATIGPLWIGTENESAESWDAARVPAGKIDLCD